MSMRFGSWFPAKSNNKKDLPILCLIRHWEGSGIGRRGQARARREMGQRDRQVALHMGAGGKVPNKGVLGIRLICQKL